MRTYKAIIVENTLADANAIKQALGRLFPAVTIVAEETGVFTAVTAIRNYKPDFIILDVELDNGRLGFEVLDALSDMSFKTLFVSAYNKYMRRAFLANAVDFLEKPFTDEEFNEAMAHTLKKATSESVFGVQQQLDRILKYVEGPVILNSKLRLVDKEGVHPTAVSEIVYLEAKNNRTAFWRTDGKHMLVSSILKDYEELLERYNFVRIHRSYVVNMEHIEKYDKKGHDLIMHNYPDIELAITPEYRSEFDQRYLDYTFGE